MRVPVSLLPHRTPRWRRDLASWFAVDAAPLLRSSAGDERAQQVVGEVASRVQHALRDLARGPAMLDDAGFASGFQHALTFLSFQHDITAHDTRIRTYCDVTASLAIFELLLVVIAEELDLDEIDVARRLADAADSWREPLLAAGRRLLAAGRADEAADCARRALQVMTACQVSQSLLLDATDAHVDLRGRFCGRPFEVLVSGQSTGWDDATDVTKQLMGAAYLCDCAAWVPAVAGNVVDATDPDAVWNSEAAQEIRRSVLDGDFSYCSRTLCPFIVNDSLPRADEVTLPRLRRIIDEHVTALDDGPELVALGHDSTCNLACPSCRVGIISANEEERRRLDVARDRVILPMLRDRDVGLHLTAWGDPFASRHYRSILEAIGDPAFDGVRVHLLTNGLGLRPKVWETMPHLASRVVQLRVSIDAATKETYEDVRRPGKWEVLYENLRVMGEMNRAGAFHHEGSPGSAFLSDDVAQGFALAFVVQQANYREMPAFVRLGEEVGADAVLFQRYYSFGHEGADVFAARDVSAPTHPEHDELRRVLADPAMRRPIVAPIFHKQLATSE